MPSKEKQAQPALDGELNRSPRNSAYSRARNNTAYAELGISPLSSEQDQRRPIIP
jgi:hypothetical protein